jgi:predicted naringenin-chalcone synthase
VAYSNKYQGRQVVISGKEPDRRRAEREPFIADVDLILDAETLEAMTVDISSTGVRIDMSTPLTVNMRFVAHGQLQDRKARLVRIHKTPDDGMTYGFEFIS